MARKLDTFPTPPSAQPRYPWQEYLDGSVWELERGVDFTAKVATMRTNAQNQAKRRGGRVKTRQLRSEDGRELVVLQFIRAAS